MALVTLNYIFVANDLIDEMDDLNSVAVRLSANVENEIGLTCEFNPKTMAQAPPNGNRYKSLALVKSGNSAPSISNLLLSHRDCIVHYSTETKTMKKKRKWSIS